MIKKLLFTVLIAIGVFSLFKFRSRSGSQTNASPYAQPPGKISTPLIAYIIIGFLVLFSGLFFAINWFETKNQVTVRVINSLNQITQYQVKESDLKRRSFTTLDGRRIELGSNERMEVLP